MKQGTTLLLLLAFAVVAAAIVPSVRASGNGCLYKCDISVGQPCVFEAASQSEVDECTTRIGVASMTAISTIAQHSLASGCAPEDAASFGTQQCNAFSSSSVPDGTCGTTPKAATPQPLTNGDCVKTTAAAVSPDTHNWAAIQSYGMALRNKIMYDPTSLASPTLWNLWTRPLTDCHIKTDTVTPDGKPTEYNSASVYQLLQDPCSTTCATDSSSCGGNGPATVNYLLQFLEEGIIDLGCLVSPSLSVGNPDRCATIRSELGVGANDKPDCWVDGWTALFGTSPNAQGLDTYNGAAGSVQPGSCPPVNPCSVRRLAALRGSAMDLRRLPAACTEAAKTHCASAETVSDVATCLRGLGASALPPTCASALQRATSSATASYWRSLLTEC